MRADVDVLCVGEAMLVLSPDGDGIERAEQFAASVGGAEANVAVTLARKGRRAAWASVVGADPVGRRVCAWLVSAGVDVSRVRAGRGPTGLYLRGGSDAGPVYYRAGSAASRMAATDADDWASRVRPRVVHVSGITAVLSESAASLCHAIVVDRVFGDAAVSFDVNHRPALAQDDTPGLLARLARSADIVFVGRDESARLWGTTDADSVRALLPEPGVLVVKDADVEAVEFEGARRTSAAAPRVDIVEATGAGDAFAAGWLDAWLAGLIPTARIEAGHLSAGAALRSRHDVPVEATS